MNALVSLPEPASAAALNQGSSLISVQNRDVSERQATVLFADVSGSTKLYETAGDAAALEGISGCLAAARKATEAAGGRVVKTIGDEIMAVFARPDAAAVAAAEMHGRIDALPEVAGTKLGVRIGFHHGPVLQQEEDLFGDTVNIASRLAEQAKKFEIITSAETAAKLGPIFRRQVRALRSIPVKGKAEEVAIAELVWRVDDNATVFAGSHRLTALSGALRLTYKSHEILRRRGEDSIVLGRDADCGLVIEDGLASRQHCTVERRQDKFILRDHSTNGTYVTFEDGSEILILREELTLGKHGWIACGQPRAKTEPVEFFCG
jgi:class 3 adenylate cyclase